MKKTLLLLQQIRDEDHEGVLKGIDSSLNFAVGDGQHVVATRYRTSADEEPPSLYYALDMAGEEGGDEEQKPTNRGPNLWVASEPLDGSTSDGPRTWHLLAKDQMISFDSDTGVAAFHCLSKACEAELEYR